MAVRVSIRSARGIALVEAMAAGFLLMIGVISLAQSLVTAVSVNTMARDHARSVGAAQDRIELLRLQGYAGLTAGGDLTTMVAGYNESVDVDGDGVGDVLVLWLIDDDTPVAGCKSISVRARPLHNATNVGNQLRALTLVTYLADRGDAP